jgi:dolichol kinase
MIASIIFFLIILVGLILNEFISRRFLIPVSFSRKIAHVFSSLVVFCMPYFLVKDEIIAVSLTFALLLFFTRNKNTFSSIHSVERKTFGEIFLPMGVIICALIFLPDKAVQFQFGILIMGISDALASIVGGKYGKHGFKIFGHKKSLEGSGAFLISSLIIVFFFTGKLGGNIIFIPVILTLVESFLILGLDNLILPMVGAYLIQLYG